MKVPSLLASIFIILSQFGMPRLEAEDLLATNQIQINSNTLNVKINSLRGRVQWKSAGDEEWKSLDRDSKLTEDDQVRTGADSFLELDLSGVAQILMLKPSVLRLKAIHLDEKGIFQIGLRAMTGRYRMIVDPSKKPNVVVETKDGRVSVRGTDFLLDAGLEKSSVYTLNGLVAFNSVFQTGEPVLVPAGKFSEVSRVTSPTMASPTPLSVYQEWNVPAPIVSDAKHEDLVLPNSNESAKALVVKNDKVLPVSNAVVKTETNLSPTNLSNAVAKVEFEKEEDDPIFPKWPWEFKFKNGLTFGYFGEPGSASSNPNYGYTLTAGGLSIANFGHWAKLVWSPELTFGPLTMGFYFPIIFGARDQFYLPTKWYNANEWDFQAGDNDLLNKIVFIDLSIWRFNLRYGGIPGITWGSGFILNGYNNMVDFPNKRVSGLRVKYLQPKAGFNAELFSADLTTKLLAGLRIDWQPLKMFTPPSKRGGLGLLGELTLGANYVLLDQPLNASLSNYVYTNLSALTNTTNSLDGFGLDLTLPLGKDPLTFKPYLNWGILDFRSAANTITFGSGFSAGASGKALIFNYLAEGYYNLSGFQPNYFDSFENYSFQRTDKISNLLVNQASNSLGYQASLGATFGKVLTLKAGYEAYFNAVTYEYLRNKVYFDVSLEKGALKGIYGKIYYLRRNVVYSEFIKNIFDQTTLAGADVHWQIFSIMELLFKLQLSFTGTSSTPTWTTTVDLNFAAPEAAKSTSSASPST